MLSLPAEVGWDGWVLLLSLLPLVVVPLMVLPPLPPPPGSSSTPGAGPLSLVFGPTDGGTLPLLPPMLVPLKVPPPQPSPPPETEPCPDALGSVDGGSLPPPLSPPGPLRSLSAGGAWTRSMPWGQTGTLE